MESLRKELDKVSKKLKNVNYYRNLEEAINEYEHGHYLASALISSRTIVYLLDQLKGKDINEKIKRLEEGGILKKRKDIKESIIKSCKLSRNFTSHDIKIFPKSTESLSLLADSITLTELLSEYTD